MAFVVDTIDNIHNQKPEGIRSRYINIYMILLRVLYLENSRKCNCRHIIISKFNKKFINRDAFQIIVAH